MTSKNLLDIVIACENTLGWLPSVTEKTPRWKARTNAVAVLKTAIAKDPNKFTIDNLDLAIEYSRRKRLPVKKPADLVFRVDDALELAADPFSISDIGQAMQDAVDWELNRKDDDSRRWIQRLTRAAGDGRQDVLAEWKADGRG